MNFVRFLENQYQELRWLQSCEEINDKPFRASLDAEIKASHEILDGYRRLLKWLLIPKVLCHYLMVQLHLAKQPTPILVNKMREQKQRETAPADVTLPIETPA